MDLWVGCSTSCLAGEGERGSTQEIAQQVDAVVLPGRR